MLEPFCLTEWRPSAKGTHNMNKILSWLFGSIMVVALGLLAYFAVTYPMSLVPAGEWQGLIKLGVALVVITSLGGAYILFGAVLVTLSIFFGEAITKNITGTVRKLKEKFTWKLQIVEGGRYNEQVRGNFTVEKINGIMVEVKYEQVVWGSQKGSMPLHQFRRLLEYEEITRLKE